MIAFDDWSDFELSKAAAKIVTHDGKVEVGNSVVHIHQYHNGICIGWKTFDINSWADMGPVIEGRGISLYSVACPAGSGLAFRASDMNDNHDSGWQPSYCRAAAVVLLMMNGVKP